MLLGELFESKETDSLKKNAPPPIKPEKGKLAFPKKEIWHHTSSGKKREYGWHKVDVDASKIKKIKNAPKISKTKQITPKVDRDSAPKGMNQKYKKLVKPSTQGIG